MWGIVFGWAFISTIVVVLIGIGFSAMSMNPPPYILAKACFSLAAVILSVRLGWWLASEENSRISRSQAIIFAFVIFGLIGAFWIWSLKWVIERGRSDRFGEQHASVAPAIMQTTNQSSSELPNFKLSLLGGNVFIPGQDQNLTGIVLKVRIRNAGTPSIATD